MPSNIVFITGCSTGIGQDLARRLALADYTVVATARHPETLADLPAALKLALDVTDAASVAGAVAEVIRRFGRVDVLVNNAGYAVRGAVEEVSDEQVHAMFDVNVYGVMRMVRAVAPHMRQQRAGRIERCPATGAGPLWHSGRARRAGEYPDQLYGHRPGPRAGDSLFPWLAVSCPLPTLPSSHGRHARARAWTGGRLASDSAGD
jgi:NAD(P)-dependent dehydrogenase (short-subunit alcohol dehydrogenase family)